MYLYYMRSQGIVFLGQKIATHPKFSRFHKPSQTSTSGSLAAPDRPILGSPHG